MTNWNDIYISLDASMSMAMSRQELQNVIGEILEMLEESSEEQSVNWMRDGF